MTEPLQVGQFAIVDGEPVDRGPNAGVFHGKGPADDRAELFILAEGTTPAGEAFAGHVVSAIGQVYASLDMSLTGSLRRLFAEAERNLRDWNSKSIAQHRVAIGLSAFGRRGNQAVIAQAGPSAAFHLHEGRLDVYSAEGAAANPIGGAPVEPQLTRIPFDAADRLLLISSHAVGALDEELIAGILALPEDKVLPDLYRRVQQLRQVTVILVTGPHPARRGRAASEDEYVIDATAGSSGASNSEGETYQPSLFIDDESESAVQSARAMLKDVVPRKAIDTVVPVMVAEVPAPLLRVSGESASAMNRLAAEGAARAARSRAAVASIAEDAAPARLGAWRTRERMRPAPAPLNAAPGEPPATSSVRAHKSQSFSRGLVTPEAPPARPEPFAQDLPLVDDLAAGRRARAALGTPVSGTLASENGAALSGGAPLVRPRTNMGGRWKGGNSIGRRAVADGQLPPAWLVILGALVVLSLIAGILTVPRMLEDDNSERVAVLMDTAQQRIVASASQADPAQKRQLLTEAQAMLLEARDLGAATPLSEQLISEVAGAISRMDNVHQPQSVETVASLEQFGARPLAVSRMALSDQAAYLLDSNASQVVAASFTGAEPRVVFAENKEEKRAKPVAIAQLDQSQLGGPVLLIADSANHLYAYSQASGLRAVAFAAPGSLAISDIAVKGPDLYVLDSAQSTVYRFIQTPDGFPNVPLKALTNPDLGKARRLMVDADFITADVDGAVHRFRSDGGLAVTFSQSGIDRRLVAPETAQALANSGEIALLDGPNDRIVVLRRDGTFDRQYRAPQFASASAFAIRNGTAYIFSAGQLRRVVF